MLELILTHVPNALSGECWEFMVDPEIPRTDLLVSSVRICKMNTSHTLIRYWNRGAGTSSEWQVVRTADALAIVARLFGLSLTEFANGVANPLRSFPLSTDR